LGPVPEEGAQRPSRRARRLLPWLAGFFLAVQLVAVYLPGSPDGGLELPWLPGADKVVHCLIFAIPVYFFGRLTRRVGLVAGLFALHAVVSELVQWRFIPYRDGDPWDAVADLIGIGLAVLLLRRTRTSWR
jgi:VanZ family protein